jgi:hypothetical protein
MNIQDTLALRLMGWDDCGSIDPTKILVDG